MARTGIRFARLVIIGLLALFAVAAVHAATPVDFYATVSGSSDVSMLKMTTDLFFTQLQSLDGYAVIDRRDTLFSADTASVSNISFYAEIQEDADGWVCTLHATQNGKYANSSKKYANYYKILLDAKSSLETLFSSLAGTSSGASAAATSASDVEKLAGTWSGEPQIDKVVILRGGRGFVIFRNGASMNIAVEVRGSSVTIRQVGKFNASFYPELPRSTALQNADTAPLIEWNLTISGNTMSGTKTTLVEDSGSTTGAASGTVEVNWLRR